MAVLSNPLFYRGPLKYFYETDGNSKTKLSIKMLESVSTLEVCQIWKCVKAEVLKDLPLSVEHIANYHRLRNIATKTKRKSKFRAEELVVQNIKVDKNQFYKYIRGRAGGRKEI